MIGFTAFPMMEMGCSWHPGAPWMDSYQQKVCGYALEDGYQAWQRYDPRRGS